LSPNETVLQTTSVDTSAMYMASGYLESADNTEIYLFHSGQPFTHGSDAAKGLDSMPATTTQLTYTWVL